MAHKNESLLRAPHAHLQHEIYSIPAPPRRSWRRSRVSIPDRTSSLSHRPKKNRPKLAFRPQDSISLHNRGCKLFSSIDEILALNRQTPPPRYSEATSRPNPRQSSEVVDTGTLEKASTPIVDVSSTSELPRYSVPSSRRDSGYSESGTTATRTSYNTVILWTSHETRRLEYEKIDRAHTGWRGFLNKIMPRSWRRGRRDFFRGEGDEDSVRRYRVSLPEKSEESSQKARKWTCL